MAVASQMRVDEEISKQIRLLCDLRTQRNAFSFVSRLATETLETIFIYAARDYHDMHGGSRTPAVPSWVNVSYVCRHWRNVAVNCPTLWSYPFMRSLRWTDELLARSKKASLKIHARSYGVRGFVEQHWSCFMGQVLNHMERIQELHLVLPQDGLDDRSFSNLLSPAPRLQNLSLSYSLRDSTSSQPQVLLFNGDTPVLHTLELSFCQEPWYLFKLTGLTTLKLRHVPNQFRQSTMEFLATLSTMQGLMHLYLQDALASAAGFLSSPEFHAFQKFNLPHLSHLLIVAPLSTVTAFLACVNIPVEAQVMLDCGSESGFTLHDCASFFFSVLAQRFSTASQVPLSPTFRSLFVEPADYCSGHLKLTFSLLEHDCDPSDFTFRSWASNNPLKITVYVGSSNTNDSLDGILNDIPAAVTLMDIQSIHVTNPPMSSTFWVNVLRHCRDLRHLKLSSGDLPDLAPVLSLTGRTASKGTSGQQKSSNRDPDQMLVPALEELELHGILFQERLKKDKNKQLVDLQALCDALATRKGSNGQLTMTRCTERKVTARWTKEKRFNMVGHWKNGSFHAAERHKVEWW